MKTLTIFLILIYLTLTACTTKIANVADGENLTNKAPSCDTKPLLREWRSKLPSEYSGQIEYLDFSNVNIGESFSAMEDVEFGTLQGMLRGNDISGDYILSNSSDVEEGDATITTYNMTMKTTYDVSCDTLTICYSGWYVDTNSSNQDIQFFTAHGTKRMPDNFEQVKFLLTQVDGFENFDELSDIFGYFGESFTSECIEFK